MSLPALVCETNLSFSHRLSFYTDYIQNIMRSIVFLERSDSRGGARNITPRSGIIFTRSRVTTNDDDRYATEKA